jgi:pimeloyl-ACP methyl ester carboxylesterase
MGGLKGLLDSIRAFSESDFTPDLKKFDKPTLVIHGDDDQIVPIDAAGLPDEVQTRHPLGKRDARRRPQLRRSRANSRTIDHETRLLGYGCLGS